MALGTSRVAVDHTRNADYECNESCLERFITARRVDVRAPRAVPAGPAGAGARGAVGVRADPLVGVLVGNVASHGVRSRTRSVHGGGTHEH